MQKLSKNIVAILRILNKHNIEYVVVGGVGNILHGADISTKDIDVCPATSKENFKRLSNALIELKAKLRGAEDVEVPIAAGLLENMHIGTWVTPLGDLDTIHTIPAGLKGERYNFEKLYQRHTDSTFEGLTVHVASLKDIVASKRFAGRPKDLAVLPELEELLKQLEEAQE
ncbi:MAG TPA: hypothetical protein PKB15_07660 [Acidimicrobiia bacterium]|nr:hypothetical protein [Acidimicrobiia bacterium]